MQKHTFTSVAEVSRLAILQSVIASGRVALGAVLNMGCPETAEMAGYAGLDFVWIDSEHGAMGIDTIKQMIVAAASSDCAPLVRVRANDANLLKPVLDLNPAGVIIPMVMTAEDAEAAVSACRYPLGGIRGCGVKRGAAYNAIPLGTYFDQSDDAPWVIVQIEHIRAVENLDKILAVKGLNSICIGPCDLAMSMGYSHDLENEEVQKVIDEICRKTKQAGLVLGTASGNLPRWRQRGIDWFAGTGDAGLVAAGFRAFRQENALP